MLEAQKYLVDWGEFRRHGKMIKKNLAWSMAVGFVVFTNCASACSCGERLRFEINPSQNIDRADVIFVAEILNVTHEYVTVSPIEVFKGKISHPMVLRNASRGVDCNYFGFNKARVGDRHLLFNAYSRVSACSYSAPIENSRATLEILRKHFK